MDRQREIRLLILLAVLWALPVGACGQTTKGESNLPPNIVRLSPYVSVGYSPERSGMLYGGLNLRYLSDLKSKEISSFDFAADISLNLSVGASASGIHYSPKGKFVIDWGAGYDYSPIQFWGVENIGQAKDAPSTSLTSHKLKVKGDFLYRDIRSGIYIGPIAGLDFYRNAKVADSSFVIGLAPEELDLFTGLHFIWDKRDNMVYPTRGVCMDLLQRFFFPLRGGTETFYNTTALLDVYIPAWKGAVFMLDFYGDFVYGNAPWMMWPLLGQDSHLRGYYNGRYREKNLFSAQLEFRQKIKEIHAIVVWGGAGWMFHDVKSFNVNTVLPTVGLGYRLNVGGFVLHIDFGVGREWQNSLTAGFSASF